MRFFAIAAALVSVVVAEKFTVIVAENGGLTYTPPSVTAKVGDTIAFQFQAGNHTVTQSTFANPCTPMTTPVVGIDSGFLPVAAGATQFPEWSFTIDNASAPLWFFCNRPPHCSRGMVFALNPTPERTYDAFLATALATGTGTNTTNTTAPDSAGATPSASVAVSGTATGTGASASGTDAPAANGAHALVGSVATLLATVGIVAGFIL